MSFRLPAMLAALLISLASFAPLAAADDDDDDAETRARVSNRGPSAVAGSASGPSGTVVPSAGGDVNIPLSIRARDDNGHRDIRVTTRLVGPDGQPVGPAVAATGGSYQGSATEGLFGRTATLSYHDAPGTYSVVFEVRDASGARAPDVTITFNYGTILALRLVESALDFGELSPGQSSATLATRVENMGNVRIDLLANGTALANGTEAIPVGAVRLGTSATSVTTSLTATGVTIPTNIVPGAGSGASLYWALDVPAVLPGDYRGNLMLAAVAAS